MIWIVGSAGMLGCEVRGLIESRTWKYVATDVELDITSEDDVIRYAATHRPDWILNCAAYTAVDRAEGEEQSAHAVNALGARHLALAASSVGARLLHVSTDYVFSGRSQGPYLEDATPDPIGAYGRTKEAGEALIRATCPEHFIVRTAWLHGPHGGNFVATMLRLMAERPSLQVVDDQRGSPTYAADLAEVLLTFVTEGDAHFGTYHYASDGACSWHAFAVEIQSQAVALGLLDAAIPIEPIPTTAYPTPAPRPANSVLSTDRIRSILGLSIPRWQDGLSRHLHLLKGLNT